MGERRDEQTILEVPTFNFSLKDLPSGPAVPELFQSPTPSQTRRKPGFLTNIRKTTVSHLLQVFRPEQEDQCQAFLIKKRLVTNAIEAIYEHKAAQKQKQKDPNPEKQPLVSKQFERSVTASLYHTPKKQKNYEDSTETTRRSASQSKLNYSRFQSKFKEEDKLKLRRRAGLI